MFRKYEFAFTKIYLPFINSGSTLITIFKAYSAENCTTTFMPLILGAYRIKCMVDNSNALTLQLNNTALQTLKNKSFSEYTLMKISLGRHILTTMYGHLIKNFTSPTIINLRSGRYSKTVLPRVYPSSSSITIFTIIKNRAMHAFQFRLYSQSKNTLNSCSRFMRRIYLCAINCFNDFALF